MKHEELTDKIIGAYYKVYNTLGYGFLEKVYHNALLIELSKLGLKCRSEMPIMVFYEGQVVGNYYADIMVDNKVIVELKAAEYLVEAHGNQLLNYLKATEVEVGLLLNFGKEPKIARKIYTF
jgi:GxxExxY protein